MRGVEDGCDLLLVEVVGPVEELDDGGFDMDVLRFVGVDECLCDGYVGATEFLHDFDFVHGLLVLCE